MINPLQKQILAILFAGGDAVEISRVAQAEIGRASCRERVFCWV